MPRPSLPRRRSSKKGLLPLLALGQVGRSNSFTLKAPTSLGAAPIVQSTGNGNPGFQRSQSCPRSLSGRRGNESFSKSSSPSSATELNMIPGLKLDMMPTFNLADAASGAANIATGAADFISGIGNDLLPDPQLKKAAANEGMNLMSHALLDLPAMVAQATVAAKAAEVAGRLFILGQDVLPGHGVAPDELAFQIGFFAVSCNALYQTVMPKIKAAQASKFLTPGDRKAFRSLFQPAGLTWEQFRELSLTSMEWAELQPGQVLDADQAYWLYQGDIFREGEGDGSGPSTGLMGADHIARTLGIFNGEEIKSSAVAGPEGAKVLKFNSEKLGQKMKHDEGLSMVLNRVLYNDLELRIEQAANPIA